METNLQKYLAFVRTAELGSFTEAAEELHYSQSGVSRMIADLEHEWNITLLERGRSGLTITSDGLALLPHARRLCADFDRLQQQVDELKGLETGLIRIGTFSSVATHWLPRIISKFQADYPGIRYELLLGDYNEIEKWIDEGRVDCGFLPLPTVGSFDTIMLQEDRLLAVIPENHPYAHAKAFPVALLDKEPFMMLEKGSRSEITGIFEKHGITPNIHFTTWDDYSIMSMVEQGLGISILPELILRRVPYHIAILPLDDPAYRRIGFVMKNRATAPLVVRRLIAYLDYRADPRPWADSSADSDSKKEG